MGRGSLRSARLKPVPDPMDGEGDEVMREFMTCFQDDHLLGFRRIKRVDELGVLDWAEFIGASHNGQERAVPHTGQQVLGSDRRGFLDISGSTTRDGAFDPRFHSTEEISLDSSHAVAKDADSPGINLGTCDQIVNCPTVVAGGLNVDLPLGQIPFPLSGAFFRFLKVIDGGEIIHADPVAMGLGVESHNGIPLLN